MEGGYCYSNGFINPLFYTLQKSKPFLGSLHISRGLYSYTALWLPTAFTELVQFKDYFCCFVYFCSTLH